MVIIGIDPGLRNIGYAVLLNGVIKFVDSITTKPKQHIGASLSKIHNNIEKDIIQIHQPDLIAIEKIYYTPRVGSSYLNTAAVIGIIEMIAYQRNVKTVQYSPPSIKKFICGNGRANKDDVKQAVIQRYAHAPDIVKID